MVYYGKRVGTKRNISEGVFNYRYFKLNMENVLFHYKEENVGEVKGMNLFPFLFYNVLIAEEILIHNALAKHKDLHIEKLRLQHSVFNLSTIYFKGNGDFGTIKGYINLDTKIFKLFLEPIKGMNIDNIVLWNFKQTKKGLVYESDF